MRCRGAYRREPQVVATRDVYIRGQTPRPKPTPVGVEQDDVEMEDLEIVADIPETRSQVSFPKKRKWAPMSSPVTPVSVITIDSDDDELEELPVVSTDSDYSSASISSSVSEIKPFSLSKSAFASKCRRCRRPLPRVEDDYNELTSADFYKNPRAHPSVIPLELRDRNRFGIFEEAIRYNRELFVDKTVLVIGSGNSLLALLAGKARARTVIVVDKPGVASLVEMVLKNNRRNMPNKRTDFFVLRQGVDFIDIDEMVLPNGISKVDIIVSDWANHSLFFKSMIDYFIKARDKFLKKGGHIFPDGANLYLSAAHDNVHKHTARSKVCSESLYVKRIDYWDKNVYSFDMSAIRAKVLSEPFHEYIKRSQVLTNELVLRRIDLYTISLDKINFSLPFQLDVTKDHYLQMFALFFDVRFTRRTATDIYSTRPSALKTMFRPTLFFVDFEKQLALQKKDKIVGRFTYTLNKSLNFMSAGIDFEVKNQYYDVKEKLRFASD